MRRRIALALLVVLVAAAGCREHVDASYGRRSGFGQQSVNGTAVLADMFQRAGHAVTTRSTLSPKLRQKTDCVVWFPDDFSAPPADVRAWLESWLRDPAHPGRTLIYVGRDFDAEAKYWGAIKPLLPADQRGEAEGLRVAAEAKFQAGRTRLPDREDARWFTAVAKAKPRKVQSLQGEDRWLEGVDPALAEIELTGRLVPPEDAEVLLASGEDALVSLQTIGQGQLIVVANGSFLLNLPLVNHEHRKLAGHLIDEIGPPSQNVVFLQSFAGGPPIREKDPPTAMPSGLQMFNTWPANWILMHLTLVGLLLCFARFPIFGRPVEPEPAGLSDFGKHIEAVGQWLARSRDHQYAANRLAHYQQIKEEG